MATFNKFNCFVENMAEKVHNLGADTLKIMLTNSLPSASNTVKSDISEISAASGYTAGGVAISVTSSAQSSGTYKLVGTDPTITVSGSSFPTFRYGVLYNDTPTSPADPLIGWWDYGSQSPADTQVITFDLDGTNGILQLA